MYKSIMCNNSDRAWLVTDKALQTSRTKMLINAFFPPLIEAQPHLVLLMAFFFFMTLSAVLSEVCSERLRC